MSTATATQDQIHTIEPGQAEWPGDRFADLIEMPERLDVRGNLRLLAPGGRPRVAVIGARSCTIHAEIAARQISAALTRAGADVVTTLDIGTGQAVTDGALMGAEQHGRVDEPGRVLAVVPTGADVPFPAREPRRMGEVIESGGAVVSVAPRGCTGITIPASAQRTRLMVALADAVIVVEARFLMTAQRHGAGVAHRLGRPLFAVTGREGLEDGGCLELVQQSGAQPIADARPVLAALGL